MTNIKIIKDNKIKLIGIIITVLTLIICTSITFGQLVNRVENLEEQSIDIDVTENTVIALETQVVSMHDDIIEIKADVKELLKNGKE